MIKSLKAFLVFTVMIFYTFYAGNDYLIELTTSFESSANTKICCLSLSLLEADKTLRVLLDNFLPLCYARTNVAKAFFMTDRNSIFVYKVYIILIKQNLYFWTKFLLNLMNKD